MHFLLVYRSIKQYVSSGDDLKEKIRFFKFKFGFGRKAGSFELKMQTVVESVEAFIKARRDHLKWINETGRLVLREVTPRRRRGERLHLV